MPKRRRADASRPSRPARAVRRADAANAPDETDHAAHVEAWLGRAGKGLSPPQLATLFERALCALWRRAEVTLGEVTLTAIVDRVLHTASEKYPFVSAVKVGDTGICFDEFHQQGATKHHAELHEAVPFVLVECLTVIGHLTDEILTPALHAELSSVALERPGRTESKERSARGARR